MKNHNYRHTYTYISDEDCSLNNSIKSALIMYVVFCFTKHQRESWHSLVATFVDTLTLYCLPTAWRKIKQWNTFTTAESVPAQLKKQKRSEDIRQKNWRRLITSVNTGTPGWTFWNNFFPFHCQNLGKLPIGWNKLATELNAHKLPCTNIADFKSHTSEGSRTSQAIAIKINEYVNR